VRTISRIQGLSVLALASTTVAFVLVFFVVPDDADQGYSQRIFYLHVPIALTAYACFFTGAWKAFKHLWRRDPEADLESYVAVHQGVIFGTLTLLTGSIWAKISWGHWWLWSEKQLVLFLVLFLFYGAYFMLRYSVEPGPQRANFSAVYALFGVVLIPISFLAIRLAQNLIHPAVFTLKGPNFHGTMLLTFCISWVAMLALAATLYQVELAGKRLDARLRELRELVASDGRSTPSGVPSPPRLERVAR
jgi:heme exporter protein C